MPCRNHPFIEEGLEHCEICTETYCGDCLVEFRDRRTCGECKAQIVADLEGGLGVGGEGELPPWEERAQIGLLGAFWETTKRVTLAPTAFFTGVDKRSERWDCLFYVIILQVIVAITAWIYQTLFMGAMLGWTSGGDASAQEAFGTMFGAGVGGFIGVILSPVSAALGVLLGASLIHVFLLATKTATRPWHQTMRHYCYAHAPGLIGAAVPFIGAVIGGIWALVATVIMTKRVHNTTTGTALAAVFWPLLLALCCGGGLAAIIGFSAVASGQ